MPTFTSEATVNLPLSVVWAKFQDVHATLPKLSPAAAGLVIEAAEPLPPRVGTTVTILANGPLGRVKWVARYVEFVPPHDVIFSAEARFVDEQISGPFKSWRHAHEFEAVDSRTTRCVDHVTYTPPYGPLGWLANPLVIRPALRKMFAYRDRVMATWT